MQRPGIGAWVAFILVCFFWGTTFLAIKIGVADLPPFLFAGMRQLIAGTILCSWFMLKKEKLPSFADMKIIFFRALLMLVVGNGLLTFSEKYVTSSLAALFGCTTPFWLLGVNRIINPGEKVSRLSLIGLLVGLAGTVLLFVDKDTNLLEKGFLIGVVALVIANIGWAFGSVYSRKNPLNHSLLFVSGIQMLMAGLVLNTIGLVKGEAAEWNFAPTGIWALIYLIVFGSLVGYGGYMVAITKLSITTVSTYVYYNTVIGVFLGWLVLNEPLNPNIGLAVSLVLCGVYLVNRGNRLDRTPLSLPGLSFLGKKEKD